MVYTSLPAYIDPANWQQQQPNHQGGNTGVTSPLLHSTLPPPPPPAPSQPHGGSIRPGSMADRARMANIPMQEAQQKCPRCESTNTKFCYFNNYSLSQPRHFCKTCRRYWTRGGALRNVPVGGGCRRNKRSKSTNTAAATSKSPATSDRQTGSSSAVDMAGLGPTAPPAMRFMAPLHQLSDQHHHIGEIGLNYGLIGGVGELNFNTSLGGGGNSLLSSVGLEQWRVPQTHQFPFLSGLEASSSHGLLYPFEGGSSNSTTTSGVISQLASVKMEDNNNNNNNNNHELGLSRQFLGINNPTSDQQYWTSAAGGGATSAWTDLSAFSSSSATTNPL